MNVLSADGVGVCYPSPNGPVWAVRNVSVAAEPGRVTAVVGPSGSGKSTLLSVVGLLQRPDEGRVLFDGDDLTEVSEARRLEVRRAQIGFVFQHGALVEHLTVVENIMLPLLADARSSSTAPALELLDWIGLGGHVDKLPNALSGGEAQRVAICRAVVRRPRLLVADEPTASLDTESADVVRGVLRNLAESGTAVLVATHDPQTAAWADDTLALGAILEARS